MRYFSFLLGFVLAACGSTGLPLNPYMDKNATPQKFTACHNYGCSQRTAVGFGKRQWKKILKEFRHAPKTPQQERQRIANAIAQMETYVGKAAGTYRDVGEATARPKDNGQMDCIDETVNTTLYLRFLEAEGVFKFHETALPLHRGYFVDGAWPHNTAAIREKKTGAIFAVDAYYKDNGNPPYMVPKKEWVSGWKPEK
ncbi:MAG: hypothetical protein H6853_02515 [Rhodospirillales bacterium]|nr:hypothetical protein [Alphaproteobacteria bacterium]USO04165.1 MAG: hypothetical protein H6853_02515 [Rhodospirillales bacterium]